MAFTHTHPPAGSETDAAERADGAGSAAPPDENQAVRNLFDLRVIIGGLFTVYGVYLTILGLFVDDRAAIDKAAGVRINLWTGLGMLVLAGGFLLWAKLRPLTL